MSGRSRRSRKTSLAWYLVRVITAAMVVTVTAVALSIVLGGRCELPRCGAIIATAGVGLTALWALLGLAVARSIARPLAQLAEAARRMGAGHLDTPIASESSLVEMQAVATELNRSRLRLKRTQELALERKQRVERLLEASHEGMLTLDEAGRVTSVSAQAEALLGYPAPEMVGKHYAQFFLPPVGERLTMTDLLYRPEGAPPVCQITVLNARAQPITLAVSASWLQTDVQYHRLRERIVVLRDVSEETALNRVRANLLANVSHEFRTPLSAVAATAEILAEEGPTLTQAELRDLMNTVRIGTANLQTLVDNLLESASIEAGCFRIHCRPTDLREVVRAAEQTMQPLLERRDQRLEVALPAELPCLQADPDSLTQVLVNLLANASKFSPMGLPIELAVAWDGETATVSVLDCGPGLPASRYSDLFQRFTTGERKSDAQYGIGLGLFVVKAIVEAHGGRVSALNRPQGGAAVWFTLPAPHQAHGGRPT